jgi:hypothetical protein
MRMVVFILNQLKHFGTLVTSWVLDQEITWVKAVNYNFKVTKEAEILNEVVIY